MKSFLNILFAALAFSFTMTIAYLAKSDIVLQAVMLAFLIQWVAYIPAYIFQTEKFYDLTGPLDHKIFQSGKYMLEYTLPIGSKMQA